MSIKNSNLALNSANKLFFLRKFIESPFQIGSVTPSSKFLAAKMLEPLDWRSIRSIAELGAGTGVFTKYIDSFKHPDCKAAVFEKDHEMRCKLKTCYPEMMYFEDALALSEQLQAAEIGSLDAVVSGLPFTLFEASVRKRIIDGVINSLKPNGIFVTFQYSLQMKTMLMNNFSQVEISFVPLNIPPAFVYVCRK
ncbi:methyltransferase small domain protein [Desulfosporosinus acididurans]|uniref:Methyltransferase small domain protein n=1 Tax=Desulfosporosinus acididurans TaxID=476652 RepID=A0A0J1FQP6_9FIRM|nr:methyltransferase [Desulfosporosinus acididurans]KLU65830.1 methyltransferase small domain protein [Desulfosporosinus acididurans]